MQLKLACCLIVVAFSSLLLAAKASAQIVYEPVRYQYGCGPNVFYYGGSDPDVVRRAMQPMGGAGRWGRTLDYAFVSGDVDVHREVRSEPLRVYTDAMPRRNARLYGFTATDAYNEANANVPNYFVKADAMATAHRDASGAVIVPSIPPRDQDTGALIQNQEFSRGSMMIRPWRGPTTTTAPATMTVPASRRGPVFVIPKDMLDRTLNSFKKQQVADAQ